MDTKTSRRPSASMIIACIALFAAIGGGAYAASLEKNSVTSKTVKNKSLKGKDQKPDTLTGNQINESTLGQVPSAANATNASNATTANSVNGLTMRSVDFAIDTTAGPTVVLNDFNGLTITATCAAGPALTVQASTSVNGAQLQSYSQGGGTINNYVISDNFTTPIDLLPTNQALQNGKTEYLNPNGEHVSVTWAADEFGPSQPGPDCEFNGVAIG